MALTPLLDCTYSATTTAPGTINPVLAVGSGTWTDNSGNNYHNIAVDGSGYLTARNPTGNGTEFAVWQGGDPQQDCVLVVDYTVTTLPGSPGQVWGFGLRLQDDGKLGLCGWGYSGHFEIKRFNASYLGEGVSALSDPASEESFTDPGTGLRAIMRVEGTSVRVQLRNPVDNTILFDQTATETNGALLHAGRPFVWAGPFANGGLDRQTIQRVRYYSGTGDPFAATGGVLSLAGVSRAGISLALSDPGVTPAYEASLDNFATAGTTIAGETGLTLDYPIADDLTRYFRAVLSETPTYSNVIAGARAEEDVRIVALADSIVAQGEVSNDSILWHLKAKLLEVHPTRTVEYVNTAVSGSATPDWEVGDDNLTDLLAAAESIDANWCLVHIGANEANVANVEAAAARLATTLAAIRTARPTMKIIVEGNTPKTPEDTFWAAFSPAWSDALDALCDGVDIIRGNTTTERTLALDPATYFADETHMSAAGRALVGQAWAADLLGTLYPKAGGEDMTDLTPVLDAIAALQDDVTALQDDVAAIRAASDALTLVLLGTVAASPTPAANEFTVTLSGDTPFTGANADMAGMTLRFLSGVRHPRAGTITSGVKNNSTSLALTFETAFAGAPTTGDRVSIEG